jgi:proteasome lid subunit RPN8/RPN11
MVIELAEAARQAIAAAAAAGYPHEVCGILLGAEGQATRRITRALPIENTFEAGERHRRYLITPRDLLAAERVAGKEGLDVLGIYHSHPDDAGIPSAFDRDHAAWTGWSYLIIPVARGQPAAIRAWRLREDRGGFVEEGISITAETTETA